MSISFIFSDSFVQKPSQTIKVYNIINVSEASDIYECTCNILFIIIVYHTLAFKQEMGRQRIYYIFCSLGKILRQNIHTYITPTPYDESMKGKRWRKRRVQ